MPAKLKDPAAPRTCRRCNQSKPFDHFYATGHGNGRRRVCIRCLNEEQRAKAGYRRHQRYNARGEVWCNYCQRYRHADTFKPHPSRPGKLWTYCRECTREIDRIRYRAKVSTPEGRRAVMAGRVERHRRLRQREVKDRSKFVESAVDTLLRRGFTLSEVARLAGFSVGIIYGWRYGKTPSLAAENRLAIVLRETAHLPIGDIPTFRRRKPHPELAFLIKRLAPQLEPYPMRDSWRYGRRGRERRAA